MWSIYSPHWPEVACSPIHHIDQAGTSPIPHIDQTEGYSSIPDIDLRDIVLFTTLINRSFNYPPHWPDWRILSYSPHWSEEAWPIPYIDLKDPDQAYSALWPIVSSVCRFAEILLAQGSANARSAKASFAEPACASADSACRTAWECALFVRLSGPHINPLEEPEQPPRKHFWLSPSPQIQTFRVLMENKLDILCVFSHPFLMNQIVWHIWPKVTCLGQHTVMYITLW